MIQNKFKPNKSLGEAYNTIVHDSVKGKMLPNYIRNIE